MIDSSGMDGGAPSTQLNIIGASSRREKTNKEAHVRQIDEGCKWGRGAGAVCWRDKSTLGPRGRGAEGQQ